MGPVIGLSLAQHFRVVRLDTRGHGRSPVPPGPYVIDDLVDDAIAVLDRLGAETASVVGLSLGGMTAMRLAAREPHRVDRAGRAVRLGPPRPGLELDRAGRNGPGARGRRRRPRRSTVAGRRLIDTARVADPSAVAEFERMIASTPSEGYASCCDAIGAMDLRADLADITAPTMVIAGEDDPATPPPHLRGIADGVAGATLIVLPSAAHLASLEQPGAVNAALLEHLLPA